MEDSENTKFTEAQLELIKRAKKIEEEKEKVTDMSGRVIVAINEIQFMAGCIISLIYFKKIDDRFIQGVTSSKYSNFKLVSDILKRLIFEKFPESKERLNKFCQEMDEIGEIRNRFAHEFLMNGSDWLSYFPSRKTIHIPWKQEGDKVEKLFQDFNELKEKVEKEIQSIMNMIIVEIAQDRDGSAQIL